MHIITGLLISAFLGKKNAKTEGMGGDFVGFRNILEVKHSIPGRMRLYAPVIKENRNLGTHLGNELEKADGIDSVSISNVTGTALIQFDTKKVQGQIVFGAVAHLLGLDKEIEKSPESLVGSGIRSASESINRALYEKSGGIIDLHTLLPVALAGLGLYQLSRPGGLVIPGGFTLLWWAYMQLLAEKKT